ncbi:MAG: hypothetical protein V8R08_06625 [Coriobacteriales bacterium]
MGFFGLFLGLDGELGILQAVRLARLLDILDGLDYRFFFRGDNLADCFDALWCVFGHGLLHANSPLISLAF